MDKKLKNNKIVKYLTYEKYFCFHCNWFFDHIYGLNFKMLCVFKELTENWNLKNPDKKPKSVKKITKNECIAFFGAIIHMGLSKKTQWKDY